MHRHDALALFDLPDQATVADIRTAFRLCAKTVHMTAGAEHEDRLRQLIAARDLLLKRMNRAAEESVITYEPAIQPLHLTPSQALKGGEITVSVPLPLELIDDRQAGQSLMHQQSLTLTLPAGLRQGETVQLEAAQTGAIRHRFLIHLLAADGLRVIGDDLWMSHALEPTQLRFGGQVSIDTPHGPQPVHIVRGTEAGACLCLKGLGLPATDTQAQGNLYIRLEASAAPLRPAADLLTDFQKRWA